MNNERQMFERLISFIFEDWLPLVALYSSVCVHV